MAALFLTVRALVIDYLDSQSLVPKTLTLHSQQVLDTNGNRNTAKPVSKSCVFETHWLLSVRILTKMACVPVVPVNRKLPHRNQCRVLIVEGPLPMHRGVGDLVAIILRLQGFDARVVFSCGDALTAVSEFEPHVVIIELILDGKLAPDLADELKLLRPQMGVLLYAAHPFALELCNTAGKYFALPEPLHPDTILAELERVLSGRQATYRA